VFLTCHHGGSGEYLSVVNWKQVDVTAQAQDRSGYPGMR